MSIKQVTVFKDSLGHLHETELEAVRAEAEMKIMQFFGANHIGRRQVKAMILNADRFILALQPVASAMNEEAHDDEMGLAN